MLCLVRQPIQTRLKNSLFFQRERGPRIRTPLLALGDVDINFNAPFVPGSNLFGVLVSPLEMTSGTYFIFSASHGLTVDTCTYVSLRWLFEKEEGIGKFPSFPTRKWTSDPEVNSRRAHGESRLVSWGRCTSGTGPGVMSAGMWLPEFGARMQRLGQTRRLLDSVKMRGGGFWTEVSFVPNSNLGTRGGPETFENLIFFQKKNLRIISNIQIFCSLLLLSQILQLHKKKLGRLMIFYREFCFSSFSFSSSLCR